jgi:hypothetical protein
MITDKDGKPGLRIAYIDGLAGVAALTIAGGHGSRQDVMDALGVKLTEAIDRDLAHLRRG